MTRLQLPLAADWDPTHLSDRVNDHWTTTNAGEAVPGIMTPLALAQWGHRSHVTAMRVAHAIGAVSAAERDAMLAPSELAVRCFYGRLAVRLESMVQIGERMPGITGEEAMVSVFGEAPEGMTFAETRRRYPFIAVRLPYTMATIQRRLLRMCAENDAWWRRQVAAVPSMGLAAALAAIMESNERFGVAIDTHVTAMYGGFQPIFDQLDRLVTNVGVGDLAVLSGTGGAEMAVVTDLWKASRGEMTVQELVSNHGFHGPGEGEVSSRVWRDDNTPLRSVIDHYRSLPESDDPRRKEAEKAGRLAEMTREVLATVPVWQRPSAALVLRLARNRIPDRGRGKRAFLQGIDGVRMAARRAGELLVADAVLEDPDDPFYLTIDELARPLPRDVKELVAKRRERRAFYQRLEFRETTWAGMPDVVEIAEPKDAVEVGSTIAGTGASAGVVEGPVRVVTDPGFEDVEPGEILVAATTDPSWCSIMYVSAGLVIDLGGMLSHAAVVARELEIPCVVNAKDATRRLRTGDIVRIDGGTGEVMVLKRGLAA